MNQPSLTLDTTTINLPFPTDWSVTPIIGENVQTSLAGTDFIDVGFRKYEYTLSWETIWSDDYDELEDMINDSIDLGSTLTFIYDKFPQTQTPGAIVVGRLSARKQKAGSGQAYYSQVDLV